MSLFPAAAFPVEVHALLTQAGWFAGRNALDAVQLPADVDYPAAVRHLLAEFAGLDVRSTGAGINVTRNSILFDPFWANMESGEDGLLTYYAAQVGTALYPLGVVKRENAIICLGADGRLYLAADSLSLDGNSFAEGISNILLGIKGRMLA